MQKIKAKLLIFDFDGTLSDSAEMIVEGINCVFEMNGFRRKNREHILEQVGLPIENIFENLEEGFEKTEENTKKLIVDFKRVYYEGLQFKTKIFPGAKETLEYFYKKEKLLAVASAKRHAPLMEMLDFYGIKKFFQFIVGADDVKNRKPHPEMVEKILKKSGVKKEDAVVIGDTHFDVELAHNAGVKSCGATYGIGSKESVIRCKPTIVVDSIEELKELVD